MRRSSKSAILILSAFALVLAFVWYKPNTTFESPASIGTTSTDISSNALDLDTDAIEMSAQSVSRAVVKKVLAIEQAEVRALTIYDYETRS